MVFEISLTLNLLDFINGKYILSLRVMIGCYFKYSDPDRFPINAFVFYDTVRYYESRLLQEINSY